MRILLVSYTYPPFLQMGGPPRKVAALARELAQRGHGVEVLTANHRLGSRGFSREQEGVRVHYLRSIARYRATATINPRLPSEAHRLAGSSNVVHIFGLYDLLGPVVGLAAGKTGVPYVLEPLGMFPPIVRSLRKKRLYHDLLGRRLVSNAARIIATSELERQGLAAFVPPERLEVRPNGVDPTDFHDPPPRGEMRARCGIPSETPLILCLGRLTPKKRLGLVIDALATGSLASARAVFIGPDEDGTRAKLDRQAAHRGVSHRVLFTGPMYGRDKLEALVDADVLVLPSENENFGNVALEALACGLPVVLSDRCGIAPEINGRAGYVVPFDSVHLAEAVAKVLADVDLRERVAREGPAIAARYSWQSVADQMEDIYRAVLAEAGR